jgi:formylglycine-generating enzyme required for sulfatase activity
MPCAIFYLLMPSRFQIMLLLTLLGSYALRAAPVVDNITAAQRPGTKLVDITYDLAAPGFGAVQVTLEASSDGGTTWTVPVTSSKGHVGAVVAQGIGRVIVWNAGFDWQHGYTKQMWFRITADDGFTIIPSGSFTMGRTSGDTDSNAPPVTVNVRAFYMGKYEVTKELWDEVRSWGLSNGYTDLAAGAARTNNYPVNEVTWWDAVKWCNARSEKDGFMPCYTVDGSVMKTGISALSVNWNADGYRLPTEAEWEKAARGGVSGKRFPWGTDTISHNEANFTNNGGELYQSGTSGYHPTYIDGVYGGTSPVGSFASNGYQLYDMAGNVAEWCWDWYGASTYVNEAIDPRGPATGTLKMLRGGHYYDYASGCRVANRLMRGSPGGSAPNFGFRVARSRVASSSVR